MVALWHSEHINGTEASEGVVTLDIAIDLLRRGFSWWPFCETMMPLLDSFPQHAATIGFSVVDTTTAIAFGTCFTPDLLLG